MAHFKDFKQNMLKLNLIYAIYDGRTLELLIFIVSANQIQ